MGNDYADLFFGAFRSEGFPTAYDENKTAAHVDVLEAGFILAFIILAVAFLIILPAAHRYGKSKLFARIGVCLAVGGILTTLNFGYRWEVGSIVSNTAYKAGSNAELHHAKIGVHFGLRGVNITLYADSKDQPKELKHEIVDYNEQFDWTWDQGRFGFGPFAGRLQRQFREAQRKGLPLPILWVADYLTLDGEGYRFGRFYRTAGWYAHIAMWTAFPCWLLSVILLHTCVRYGALMLSITGLMQIIACIIWVSIRNPHPLVIPFEDAILTTRLGSDFYWVLFNGIACVILALVIGVVDQFEPEHTAIFFGIDPLFESTEKYTKDCAANKPTDQENVTPGGTNSNQTRQFHAEPTIVRRKTIVHRVRSKYRPPMPVARKRPVIVEDDEPMYSNQQEFQSGAHFNHENERVAFKREF